MSDSQATLVGIAAIANELCRALVNGSGCLENTYNTTALEIAVPSTIPSVTPQFLAPYTTTVRTQAASPVDCGYAADSTATCYLTIVRWSGVTIPLYQYAVFGLQMTLPNKANTTYYFDAVQTCFNNTVQYYNSTNGDGPNGSNIFSAPRLTTPATTTSTM